MTETNSLNAGGVISIAVMVLVFGAVLYLTLRLGKSLRAAQIVNLPEPDDPIVPVE